MFRGGVLLAVARQLAVGNEPGGPGFTEGGGIVIVNKSNSKGAHFCMGPGLVRVKGCVDCIIASPGKAVVVRYKGVLMQRKCGMGMLGAVGFSGDVRCGPFRCVRSRGSVLGLMGAVVIGAGKRNRGSDRSF